ncbi:MAG TPA: V-type ATPase subunit [Anaerolineales bacterium]|nr:V-type ATPase subunit [Anaerolineales bacterium]HNA89158.1 V-type ATPase subunit [Anaerolineales bacterium]HNB35060.1 V-type ATPase subunit [Anaerolineales bacterium]
MASGVSGYAAISTRVRAMYSFLLTPQEMARLSDSPDFSSLIGALKNTPYGKYLSGLKDNELTPRRVIHQLRNRLADSYSSVVQQAPEQTRPLVRQLFRYFEVGNLKAVLRSIQTVSSWNSDLPAWDRVREVLFPFGAFSSIPAQAMVESGSVSSAVELLHGTPYEATMSFAMKRFSTEQNLFTLEVALDLDYWRKLWGEVKGLKGKDREMGGKLIGSLLDLNNLMWVIRYKIYHSLSEEELINYTLPFGYRVRDEDIRAIAAGADIASVISRIYPNIADVNSLLDRPQSGLPKLEQLLKQQVMRQCVSTFIGDPFHIGLPLAYLLLSDFEIQDLIVLIEAKSSKLADEEFRPLLLKTNLIQ